MLRSIKDLFGYPVMATDGQAGKVKDVLFGDRHWRMRYLDVETRRGLHFNLHFPGQTSDASEKPTRRLIEVSDLGGPSYGGDRRVVPTRLTKDEVGACEGFGSHLPAEKMYEMEFRRFFHHPIYDERPLFGSFGYEGYMPSLSPFEHTEEEIRGHLDRMSGIAGEHLHSAHSVIGYHVVGEGEALGVVGDLILDSEKWEIVYLVLDTRHGIPSRKYLLGMDEVISLDWSSSSIGVKVASEGLLKLRRYWLHDSVNRDAGESEFDYSGRRCAQNLMEELF